MMAGGVAPPGSIRADAVGATPVRGSNRHASGTLAPLTNDGV